MVIKEVSEPKVFDIKKEVIKTVFKTNDFLLLAEIIRNHIDNKRESLYFNPGELNWLSLNAEFISDIVKNPKASGVFYWLYKGEQIKRVFAPYFIAKKIGVYIRTAQYWIQKLQRNGLVIRKPRPAGFGNKNAYVFNPRLRGLVSLTNEMIIEFYGQSLDQVTSKDKNKQWEAIKKWRYKNR